MAWPILDQALQRPMRHSMISSLAASTLVWIQPLICPAMITVALAAGSAVHAQDTATVAKVAQSITVRIEGATQGSGVLVKREGNRYTVLTAWHVLSGQRQGEELAIITADGQQHQAEAGSIQRVGDVDMAVVSFTSGDNHPLARLGDPRSVAMGNPIFVAGFPNPSSAVPTRLLRFSKGDVVANTSVAIPDGYQLLYINPLTTLPGMSGGPVLNDKGELVAIHGRSETDARMTEQAGVAVKTGTNQGVPISYYSQAKTGTRLATASSQAASADDLLAQSKQLVGVKGKEQELIRLASNTIQLQPTALAYFYRARAKVDLGDNQGAIADYNQAIAINPQYSDAYNNRGIAKYDLGDNQGAIADYNQAIAINPQFSEAYSNRGVAKSRLGDKQGAIADYNQAIAINPQYREAYYNRGIAHQELGNLTLACSDWRQAANLGDSDAAEGVQKLCQ